MHPFMKTDILLPENVSMEQWSVIACDQFASQPEYWDQARKLAGTAPSTLNLILPESELDGDCDAAIKKINETMHRYLKEQIFRLYPGCFVYVERTLLDGTIRKGVVGAVDLEQYDFHPQSKAAIRATEETVTQRIPPRMNIRRNAPLELPHVLLLCDDDEKLLVESLTAKKSSLPLLYDFQLMLGGGRIQGWLVAGQDAEVFTKQLSAYEKRMQARYGDSGVMYAVGDGNHSLASAKGCYQENTANEKARYALVELEISTMRPRFLNRSTELSSKPMPKLCWRLCAPLLVRIPAVLSIGISVRKAAPSMSTTSRAPCLLESCRISWMPI